MEKDSELKRESIVGLVEKVFSTLYLGTLDITFPVRKITVDHRLKILLYLTFCALEIH